MSPETEHPPTEPSGEPPALRRPSRPRHPNAKPHLREEARRLRRQGRRYPEIAAELGVSKSSVSLWVRDLPKPPPDLDRLSRMREARWAPHRERTAALRRATRAAASGEIGELTDRELLLVGVGLYWAEGAKSKPYRLREEVVFVNSDAGMVRVYLAWLRMLGIGPERLQYRVMIHETADVGAAERYWADLVGVTVADLERTTLKTHRPRTRRLNVGEGYHGCLAVRVRKAADLYRRIEGWWYGIVEGVSSATRGGCPN
ncbi:hypothetical protein GCM10023347_50150 [Streptomyces chumphonensis]|uniref:hypothetical protein n=1 Tax=Streptomyces chumphonensis TaxID=1214925 RepID=UPI001CD0F783|nr:hypothetical protein [Streptomyces chumphonensis]